MEHLLKTFDFSGTTGAAKMEHTLQILDISGMTGAAYTGTYFSDS